MVDSTPGDAVENFTTGAIPLWFDVGYRFAHPNLMIGVYLQYAPGILGDTVSKECATISCSTNVVKFGVQAQLHLDPEGIVRSMDWRRSGRGVNEHFRSPGPEARDRST